MIWQKIDYIHYHPVVAEIVNKPADFKYSSAINYEGQDGLIDITLMEPYHPIGYIHLGKL